MAKAAWVLVTDCPIPNGGKGSWVQRLQYLFTQYAPNAFEYLICHHTQEELTSNFTTRYACKQTKNRIINKLIKYYRYKQYFKAVDTIAAKHEQVIICVVDSIRIKNALWHHLQKQSYRPKVKLMYYQCGFATYLSSHQHEHFIEGLDEYIMLTNNAYRYALKHNTSFPFPVSVLHNPINQQLYHPATASEKAVLRAQLNMPTNKTIYLWAAYNRPKKGLQVVLDGWMQFYTPQSNAELWVVGVQLNTSIPGVVFKGRLHHKDMPAVIRAADIGISSSLWPEGFSLSVAEQISSGLLTIASTAGCVSDFFVDAKHGIGIDEPNLPQQWAQAFVQAQSQLTQFQIVVGNRTEPPFLTYDAWCQQFQHIFAHAEQRWNAIGW